MKIEVQKVELPSESILHERIESTDFVDCFLVNSSLSARNAAEIIVQFPKWAQMLLHIRGILVTPFGLSNDGPPAEDKIGAFPVELDTGNELVAGFDDKHLNFRISVLSQSGRVSLATWVHTNNIGGRFYLSCILPFHVMIARNGLKRVAQQG